MYLCNFFLLVTMSSQFKIIVAQSKVDKYYLSCILIFVLQQGVLDFFALPRI